MSNESEEALRKVVRRMKFRDMKPIGYCYNPACNSELDDKSRLFCDKQCSDEWDEMHGSKATDQG